MSHSSLKFVCLLAFAVLVAAARLSAGQVQPPPPPLGGAGEPGMHILATNEIAAELSVGAARERITGRVSLHFVATSKTLQEGQVLVRGLNIAFFGVSQKLLAREGPVAEPLGTLGFALLAGKEQPLRYAATTRRLEGGLRLYASASFLSSFAKPQADGKGDLFLTPTLSVDARIVVQLDQPLPQQDVGHSSVGGKLDVELRGEPLQFDNLNVPAFELRIVEPAPRTFEIGWSHLFEVGQSLCLQPVRLQRFTGRRFTPIIQYSGAGLAFGEPGARTQWSKVDVAFHIRTWRTIVASTYWELDASEQAALRNQVEDDDCIEVFFVNDLDPDGLWGGGATFGSGTPESQIISSDGNARGGIDLTHLAHELGHALGLRHPGESATASAVPASTGTLMCPSGYLNDNPRVNSQDNGTLISNPLLTFALKPRGAGPDCIDSADCGPCP